MAATKITNNIYSVGVLNPSLRIFDIVMRTDFGTSYNSYIVKGSEKTALVEVSHSEFFEQYLNNIKEVCDPSEIDYIVVNHCEPDHSGALRDVLKLCPKAIIVSTVVGANYLKNITNIQELNLQRVKENDIIDLGNLTIKFIPSPFLHWPDTMFSYCEEERVLFSCDMFGCHYTEAYVLDKYIISDKSYDTALKGYYDAIFGPFKPYVLKGLEKIKTLNFDYICTSHGPILTKGVKLESVIDKYTEWSTPKEKGESCIPIFYCSAYGNTKMLAESLCDGANKVDGVSSKAYDINDNDMSDLSALINESDAFMLGSPTINSDAVEPVWSLINSIDVINNKKRKALVFGSYGWSGEGIPNLIERLKGIKNDVYNEGLKVCFVPTEEDLKNCIDLGEEFAKAVIEK